MKFVRLPDAICYTHLLFRASLGGPGQVWSALSKATMRSMFMLIVYKELMQILLGILKRSIYLRCTRRANWANLLTMLAPPPPPSPRSLPVLHWKILESSYNSMVTNLPETEIGLSATTPSITADIKQSCVWSPQDETCHQRRTKDHTHHSPTVTNWVPSLTITNSCRWKSCYDSVKVKVNIELTLGWTDRDLRVVVVMCYSPQYCCYWQHKQVRKQQDLR